MTFKETVLEIVRAHPKGISPPDIQRIIETRHPEFYGTNSHSRNVEKGHYKDLHHALKAQVYGLVRQSDDFYCDRSVKPYLVSIGASDIDDLLPEAENLESSAGKVYVLQTGTFMSNGEEIIKIGHTTQSVEKRIRQLYTTGVPFQFTVQNVFEVDDYIELESAMHKLLFKFRLNKSREFFSERALPYLERIVEIHNAIQSEAGET